MLIISMLTCSQWHCLTYWCLTVIMCTMFTTSLPCAICWLMSNTRDTWGWRELEKHQNFEVSIRVFKRGGVICEIISTCVQKMLIKKWAFAGCHLEFQSSWQFYGWRSESKERAHRGPWPKHSGPAKHMHTSVCAHTHVWTGEWTVIQLLYQD